MFSVIKNYKIWFTISGTLVAASLVLLFTWKLMPGIDFRGGVLAELAFEKPVSVQDVRQKLLTEGFGEVVVQPISDTTVIIKAKPISEEEGKRFRETLKGSFGNYEELQFESIGPTIGRELTRNAYLQILLVSLGIILYIAYAFRKISRLAKGIKISPWLMGVAAIIALLHDILIPTGVFVVLGKYKAVEVDALFITALLTILGFSVHDTIVVFDRIRENLQKFPYKSLATIIDYSINSTLARSINTSATLIFVLISMLLFGGSTVFYFVLTLLVGVTAGTYSSIFIASPILYLWQKRRS